MRSDLTTERQIANNSVVSIHAPRGGRRSLNTQSPLLLMFQSTPPRGERLCELPVIGGASRPGLEALLVLCGWQGDYTFFSRILPKTAYPSSPAVRIKNTREMGWVKKTL